MSDQDFFSNTPTPEEPEGDDSNDGPSKTMIAIGVIVALFIFAGMVSDDETETTPATNVAEEVEEEPAQEVEEDPEPAQEEEEAPVSSSTGDYSSEAEYRREMIDTSEKLSNAFNTMAEAAGAVADGRISPSDFAELARTYKTTLRSHYDFFNDRTPPARYQEVNRLVLRALEAYDTSADYAIKCGENVNEHDCMQSVEYMSIGTDLINQASAAVN